MKGRPGSALRLLPSVLLAATLLTPVTSGADEITLNVTHLRTAGRELVDVAFVPGTSLVVVTATEGNGDARRSRISLVDTADGATVSSFAHAAHARVAALPGGASVALSGDDGSVTLRALPDGAPVWRMDVHADGGTDVAVGPRGELIVSSSRDGSVALIDARSGALRWVSSAHSGYAYAIAFSPDGDGLLSVGCIGDFPCERSLLVRHDVATGESVGSTMVHGGPVFALAWSGDGDTVATASLDRSVGFLAADGASAPAYGEEHRGAVYDVAFLPDGRHLLSVGGDGRIVAWDARAGVAVTTATARDLLFAVSLDEAGTTAAVAGFAGLFLVAIESGGAEPAPAE